MADEKSDIKLKKILPIPKPLIDKFIKSICESATKETNLVSNYSSSEGVQKIIILTNNIVESEKIHTLLMSKCCFELGDFIEKETNTNRNQWNRSITLFESVVEQNNVSIFWQK